MKLTSQVFSELASCLDHTCAFISPPISPEHVAAVKCGNFSKSLSAASQGLTRFVVFLCLEFMTQAGIRGSVVPLQFHVLPCFPFPSVTSASPRSGLCCCLFTVWAESGKTGVPQTGPSGSSERTGSRIAFSQPCRTWKEVG